MIENDKARKEDINTYLIESIMSDVSPDEFKILLFIAQNTVLGNENKLKAKISYNQFVCGCGINSHNTISKSLSTLLNHGYIERNEVGICKTGLPIYAYGLSNELLQTHSHENFFGFYKNDIREIIIEFVYNLGADNGKSKNSFCIQNHLIYFGMYPSRGFLYIYIKDKDSRYRLEKSVYKMSFDDNIEKYIKMFNVFEYQMSLYFQKVSKRHFPLICNRCNKFFWFSFGHRKICSDCEKKENDNHNELGYVYLINAVGSNRYKIGRSKDPEKRLKSLKPRTIGPFALKIVTAIKSDNCSKLECELHNAFNDKRIRGEWFLLSKNDVEYIKNINK